MKYQLKTRQICLLIIALFPITKLFVLPCVLASHAEEDMWISGIFSILSDLLTLSVVVYTCKKTDKTFFQLLTDSLGVIPSKIVLFIYLVYFMLKAIIPINEQKNYVELTLYTLMPTVTYFLPFFLVMFYLCTKKLRVFGRACDVIWLSTVVGFLTIMGLSVSNADFLSLLPMGANGMPAIFKGSFYALNWFGDSVYLMFFIGQFKYENKSGVKIFLSYFISAIMITFFMMVFYSVFTSVAYRQKFALTEISKYTTVINNIGRFDYVAILLMLFSNMFAVSLPVFISCKLFNHIFNVENHFIAPVILVGIQFFILLVFHEHLSGIESFMQNICGLFFFIMGNILPLFLPLLVGISRKKELIYEKC